MLMTILDIDKYNYTINVSVVAGWEKKKEHCTKHEILTFVGPNVRMFTHK